MREAPVVDDLRPAALDDLGLLSVPGRHRRAGRRAAVGGVLAQAGDGDEAVGHGEVILDAAVGPAVPDRLMTRAERLTPFTQLTEREHEVPDLAARGLSDGEIARRLYLSEKTLRDVVSTVLSKLPAESRPQAIAMARRRAGRRGAAARS